MCRFLMTWLVWPALVCAALVVGGWMLQSDPGEHVAREEPPLVLLGKHHHRVVEAVEPDEDERTPLVYSGGETRPEVASVH